MHLSRREGGESIGENKQHNENGVNESMARIIVCLSIRK